MGCFDTDVDTVVVFVSHLVYLCVWSRLSSRAVDGSLVASGAVEGKGRVGRLISLQRVQNTR